MVLIGIKYMDGVIVMCYFRGNGYGVFLMEEGWEVIIIGKGEILWNGDDVLILGYGFMVYLVM